MGCTEGGGGGRDRVDHKIKGQGIYAFVTLHDGIEWGPAVKKELSESVRQLIGAFAAPDVLHFAPGASAVPLPHPPSSFPFIIPLSLPPQILRSMSPAGLANESALKRGRPPPRCPRPPYFRSCRGVPNDLPLKSVGARFLGEGGHGSFT